jgi:site-specific DNA recombinase
MVVGVFSDNDISASKYSTKPRPGYHTMITALMNDGIEAILVTEMTRLYRRLDELLDLKHIITIDETGYDLSTGQGIHNAVAAVNNAMLESGKISDRVSRKFRARAKSGLAHGGSRPYGYDTGHGDTRGRGSDNTTGGRPCHPRHTYYCHCKRPERAWHSFCQRQEVGP